MSAAPGTPGAAKNNMLHDAIRVGSYTRAAFDAAFPSDGDGSAGEEGGEQLGGNGGGREMPLALVVPELLAKFLAGVDAYQLALAVGVIMDDVLDGLDAEGVGSAVATRASHALDAVLFRLAGKGESEHDFWSIPIHGVFAEATAQRVPPAVASPW